MNERDRIDFLRSEFNKVTGYKCYYVKNTREINSETGIRYKFFDSCLLCKEINKSEVGRTLCMQKRTLLLRQAIRSKRAVYSPCHAGCVEIEAPLFMNDKLRGVFICNMPPIEGTGNSIENQREYYKKNYNVDDKVLDYYTDEKNLTNRFVIEPARNLLEGLIAVIFNYKISTNYEIMNFKEEPIKIDPFSEKDSGKEFSKYFLGEKEQSKVILPDMMKNETGLAVIRNHIYHLYTMLINGEIMRAEVLMDEIVSVNHGISTEELFLNSTVFVVCTSSSFILYSGKYSLIMDCCRNALFEIKRAENREGVLKALKLFLQNIADVLIIKVHDRHMVISRMVEYINSHYYEDIKLNDVSKEMNISVAYASRLFKQQMGIGFRWYLLEVRMYYAYRYLCLSETERPVKEIAELCGYQNIRAFYAMFKKYYGCTCQQLRSMFKNNANSVLLSPSLPIPILEQD